MSVTKKIFPLIACAAMLGACAQQEEPMAPSIVPEPIFDKFGGVSGCSDGSSPSSSTAAPGQNPCAPPPDECTDTSNPDCWPTPGGGDRDPNRDPDPQGRPGTPDPQ